MIVHARDRPFPRGREWGRSTTRDRSNRAIARPATHRRTERRRRVATRRRTRRRARLFFFRASRPRLSRARLPRASRAPFVSTTNHHSSTSEVVLNPPATRVRRGGIGPRSRRDRLARRSRRRRRRRRREREPRAKRRARSSTRSIVVVARARDDPRSIVDDPRSGGWFAREISRATSRDSRISPILGDRPSHPHVRRTALIRARRVRCVRVDAVAVARATDTFSVSIDRR